MKTATLTLFIFIVHIYNVNAQKDKHLVNAGEDINNVIPTEEKFHYPEFTAASVVFKDGKISVAPCNYNLLIGQMQFVDPSGDTLAIANENTIEYININTDTFFYDNGYLQLIAGNTSAKFAKSEKIKLSDIKKTGGFGQSSSTNGISTYSSLYVGGQRTELTEKRELTLLRQTSFYIGNQFNHFLPATKKNLIKLFGKKQDRIETYLKENNTSFNSEEDLKKLVSFINETSF